jgi:nitrogen fixation protein NifQ
MTADALFNFRDDDASVLPMDAAEVESDTESNAVAAYRALTGLSPEEAAIESDESFDKHVLASILALALTENGRVGDRAGLGDDDLRSLFERCFPHKKWSVLARGQSADNLDRDEIEMVRDLLLANRSVDDDVGRWLAAMVARRAMEPNHLWEDLGLRERSELTRLLERHFRPLAIRNNKNMRWKRFFYRMMCESDGFVMCSSPVCSNCADYNQCFGPESGESRMMPGRRPS